MPFKNLRKGLKTLPTNEKKGITVKIDAELHAEVRQYLEQHGMTMADFVSMALQDELHPKFEQKEENSMEKMRTLAFQVPESLFQKIKDYLQRNNMTQRQFVIGLVENEIERDLAQRQAVQEPTEEIEETEPTEETVMAFDEDGFPVLEENESESEEMEETEEMVMRM